MKKFDSEELAKEVLKECNVYPLPSKERVLKQTEIICKLQKVKKEEDSRDAIVRRLSKALDIKTKMETNEWIKYDGESRY